MTATRASKGVRSQPIPDYTDPDIGQDPRGPGSGASDHPKVFECWYGIFDVF